MYQLEIVTPQKMALSENIVELNAPGIGGYFGILAGHIPFVTALRAGEIRVQFADNRAQARFVVSGGFVQVGTVKTTVLADSAVKVDEIDASELENSLQQLREKRDASVVGSASCEDLERQIAFADACIEAARK